MTQTAFEKLLAEKINLSASHISQGSTSHNYVRGLLTNKSFEKNDLPWIIDGDFLSGSYARGTKIYPLDDIDVMIVMDGTGLFPIQNGARLNAAVRGDGEMGSPAHYHTNELGYISSIKILESFKKHLQISYPDSEIKKDGQAVNVWLNSYGLGLDIVPCFHIIPNDGSQDYYYIPYGRGNDMWMTTNPQIDSAISDQLHIRFDKKLKPIIKIIKYWNQIANYDRLRSYHLEVIAWYVFDNYQFQISSYLTALKYFFDNANNYLSAACPDPTRLGDSIDTYLDSASRRLSMQKIAETGQLLNNASPFNHRLQIINLKKIFGDDFGNL